MKFTDKPIVKLCWSVAALMLLMAINRRSARPADGKAENVAEPNPGARPVGDAKASTEAGAEAMAIPSSPPEQPASFTAAGAVVTRPRSARRRMILVLGGAMALLILSTVGHELTDRSPVPTPRPPSAVTVVIPAAPAPVAPEVTTAPITPARAALPYFVNVPPPLSVGTGRMRAQKPKPVRTAALHRKTIILRGAHFNTSSSRIAASNRDLKIAAREIGKRQCARVQVVGYTDPSGGNRVNLPLSRARAKSVRHRLIAFGVSGRRISVVGRGSRNLQVSRRPVQHVRADRGAIIRCML